MSDISARCSNGHDVIGLDPGTPCPQCGDTLRHVAITASDSTAVGVHESGGRLVSEWSTPITATTASVEVKASGSAVGDFEWSGHAEGAAPPVIDGTQEVLLRWTPLDDATGTWLLAVHRDGMTIAMGVGDKFVRAIAQVVKDLYPDV